MTNNTCPVCGDPLFDSGDKDYLQKKCFNCGWESEPELIEHIPTLSDVLSEHFSIPCDLCNRFFEKSGDCPKEITKCNSEEHWRLLLERIKYE